MKLKDLTTEYRNGNIAKQDYIEKMHDAIGGLRSAVAAILAEADDQNVSFRQLGMPDTFCSQIGSQEYLREIYGLSVDGIVDATKSLMGITPNKP